MRIFHVKYWTLPLVYPVKRKKKLVSHLIKKNQKKLLFYIKKLNEKICFVFDFFDFLS